MAKILINALLNSTLTALYIGFVATFLNLAKQYFESPNEILIAIFMIMLFVFSATLTGILVLGKPVLWYLKSKKAESIRLLILTVLFLFIILLIVGIVLFYLV